MVSGQLLERCLEEQIEPELERPAWCWKLGSGALQGVWRELSGCWQGSEKQTDFIMPREEKRKLNVLVDTH